MSEVLSSDEYQFILKLIGEARGQGLYELEYKGLKLKLRPLTEAKASAPAPTVQNYTQQQARAQGLLITGLPNGL